jgi:hypothetical protein
MSVLSGFIYLISEVIPRLFPRALRGEIQSFLHWTHSIGRAERRTDLATSLRLNYRRYGRRRRIHTLMRSYCSTVQ